MNKKFNKYKLEIGFSVIFMALSIVLNSQFLIGSNINTIIAGHDEYIAIKEIYSIISPASFKHWLMAIISGNALYYGRIMFYFNAIVAAIPYLIFGIKGMVFTVRILQAFIILFALLLLANTFLEKSHQRVIFLLASTCIYYSMYFVMMPKPEPHQLLCLAWFLNRFKKNNWNFTWHFLLLGIAYGLKFNVLVLLPLFFITPIVKVGLKNIKMIIWPCIKSFGFFLIGILIAIPCLILTPIRPIFLKSYLHETFGGTEKLYDDSTLTFYNWLSSGLGGAYLGLGSLAMPFAIFVVYRLIVSIKNNIKNNDYSSSLLLLSGFILCLVIMLKTKRLWPHYLWTGYIFLVLGLMVSISQVHGRKLKTTLWTVIYLFIGTSFYIFLKRDLPLYLLLSERDEVIKAKNWSTQAIYYVKSRYPNSQIGTDGSVLYPFEDFVGVDLYHPFSGRLSDKVKTKFYWYKDFPEKIWTNNNDILIFFKRHPERMYIEKSNVYIGKQETLYKLYLQNINKNYVRDTSFGEVIVYKKISK